ncbi:MAG: Asp/Glu racemase [Gammaproteobacteria bacterium]|jgi:maleate isomerase|nr:Asp/Glu racemase [Gammaproteobacteria bacterium]
MTDQLGHRARIALVVPSTNTSCQPESEMLRPLGVTNQTGRISIKERPLTSDQAFMEHVQAMRDGMRTAIDQVMTCQPTHVIMGVALEAFWGGVAAANELQRELAERAGVGVSMGSTATVSALQRFGSKSIAVLTPHQPRGDEQVRRYFEEAGFSIPRLIGLKCPSPVQIAHTTRQQVVDALHALNGDDVDAIVQVGTNLAAIGICAEAERTFRKPVLAINAITYWDALRRCGIEDRIQGYGRTLEEF